jgi:hypothetical protein
LLAADFAVSELHPFPRRGNGQCSKRLIETRVTTPASAMFAFDGNAARMAEQDRLPLIPQSRRAIPVMN